MGRPAKYDAISLVDEAMEVFWTKGWQHTSIRDLEQALDMKAPSIYYRFAGKDELFTACLVRYRERVVERRIARFLAGTDDPVTELHRFFESALWSGADNGPFRGCMLNQAAADGPRLSVAARREVRRGLDVIEQAFIDHLGRAVAAGRLAAETDVPQLARQLVTAFQGLLVLAGSGEPDDRLAERLDAAFLPVRLAES